MPLSLFRCPLSLTAPRITVDVIKVLLLSYAECTYNGSAAGSRRSFNGRFFSFFLFFSLSPHRAPPRSRPVFVTGQQFENKRFLRIHTHTHTVVHKPSLFRLLFYLFFFITSFTFYFFLENQPVTDILVLLLLLLLAIDNRHRCAMLSRWIFRRFTAR